MALFDLDEQTYEEVTFAPTREAGVARWETFRPRAGRAYASGRNADLGADRRSNVSVLSPWVRHRLLMEEDIVSDTLKAHSITKAEKFLQEVFWRAYFKGWLEQRPMVWDEYVRSRDNLLAQLEGDSALSRRYEKAIGGRTGIECFDHWVGELIETGYLHNHARMWFASIWIFTLQLPWQLGADFFYRHLLDGDPASNTCSWRWVGGLHTKGKTYLARASNIRKFTDGRFFPEYQLANDAQPLDENFEAPIVPVPFGEMVPPGEDFALLITEDDCSPASLDLPGKPKAVLALDAITARSSLPVSDVCAAFTKGALQEALVQAESAFGVSGRFEATEDWADALIAFAREAGVETIAVSHVPVGPGADCLRAARPALDAADVRVVQLLRPYDAACWPHATKGFFKLKTKIPAIIEELGL